VESKERLGADLEEAPAAAGHRTVAMKVCGPGLRNFTYLIEDRASRRAAIIDPAWELKPIQQMIEDLGTTLSAVLLTHSHFDHVNCVAPLIARFPCEVFMSGREIDTYGFRCRSLNAFDDGQVIRVGGTEISCLLTPGHTAGGACYVLSDAIFTGDTIFTEGCGACTSPGASPVEMFESVQRVKRQVYGDVRVFPGHSFGMTPGQSLRVVMKENLYFQIEDRREFVAWRMRSGVPDYATR
jgi:glyoxylase-like metal-dependent hydrolase (beta-lactamase superfamily II)